MSLWRNMMNYLGLGPDDAYDDYDAPMEPERPAGRPTRPPSYAGDLEGNSVRTIPPRPGGPRDPHNGGQRMPAMGSDDASGVSVKARVTSSTVRTLPGAPAKPSTVRPRRFEQAQEIADRFKEGQPVIVNLQDIERDLSRRLIDFCSGLCYGLGGRMERVASGVYLLTPTSADVSDEDRQAISEHGYTV
jgi:cell division inhibitor SepF